MKRYVFVRLFDAGNQPIDRYVGPFADLSLALEFGSVAERRMLELETLSDAQVITTKFLPSGCYAINSDQFGAFFTLMKELFKK
ncbi:MAG: hypothetical protein WCP09_02705 [Candidatus Taylorbacteria bacterium]